MDNGTKVLITGGAGFIGQHLVRFLVERGLSVTILDNFLPQVHGPGGKLSEDLAARVRLVHGDVADPIAMQDALKGVGRIVHLAAETGTGQSMYEVGRYARTNLEGTAQIFEVLAKSPNHKVDRIVVASSRAVYGEGAYRCERDGVVYPVPRSSAEKQSGYFDPFCPLCKKTCTAAATPESAPPQPSSFYGLTKLTQEQMVLLFGQVFGIPSVALRYQNVFGPGQSLQNPYTGILAIFSNLARVGQPIRVLEDGRESRDFVYIDDMVDADSRGADGSDERLSYHRHWLWRAYDLAESRGARECVLRQSFDRAGDRCFRRRNWSSLPPGTWARIPPYWYWPP